MLDHMEIARVMPNRTAFETALDYMVAVHKVLDHTVGTVVDTRCVFHLRSVSEVVLDRTVHTRLADVVQTHKKVFGVLAAVHDQTHCIRTVAETERVECRTPL